MDTEPIPYRVELSETAVKNLRRFPHNDQRRILAQIEQLAANPQEMQGVKRLVGYDVTCTLSLLSEQLVFLT